MLIVQHFATRKNQLMVHFTGHPNEGIPRAFLSFSTGDQMAALKFTRAITREFCNLQLLSQPVIDKYERDWQFHCEKKMQKSNFLICLLGRQTHKSAAVIWELGRAVDLGMPVLPISLDPQSTQIPSILKINSIVPLLYDEKLTRSETCSRIEELTK